MNKNEELNSLKRAATLMRAPDLKRTKTLLIENNGIENMDSMMDNIMNDLTPKGKKTDEEFRNTFTVLKNLYPKLCQIIDKENKKISEDLSIQKNMLGFDSWEKFKRSVENANNPKSEHYSLTDNYNIRYNAYQKEISRALAIIDETMIGMKKVEAQLIVLGKRNKLNILAKVWEKNQK